MRSARSPSRLNIGLGKNVRNTTSHYVPRAERENKSRTYVNPHNGNYKTSKRSNKHRGNSSLKADGNQKYSILFLQSFILKSGAAMRFLIVCILCAFLGYALVLGLSNNIESQSAMTTSDWFDREEISQIWTQLKRRFWDQDIPRKKHDTNHTENTVTKSLQKTREILKSSRAEIRDLSPKHYQEGLQRENTQMLDSVKKLKIKEKKQLDALINKITK